MNTSSVGWSTRKAVTLLLAFAPILFLLWCAKVAPKEEANPANPPSKTKDHDVSSDPYRVTIFWDDLSPLGKAINRSWGIEEDTVIAHVAESLRAAGDTSVVEYLIKALPVVEERRDYGKFIVRIRDRNIRKIKANICYALGRLKDKRAVPALSDILENGELGSVPSSPANALGDIGDPSAAPALIRALRKSPDTYIRRDCAVALGKVGDRSAIPGLIQVLKEDSYEGTRQSCAEALGKIGGRSALPALKGALKADQDKWVRRSCADALIKLADLKDLISFLQPLEPHSEEELDFYIQCAQALGDSADKTASSVLVEVLKETENKQYLERDGKKYFIAYLPQACLTSLGKISDVVAILALLEALKSEDFEVVRYAKEALDSLGTPASVPNLIECLGSENEEVRLRVAKALGRLKARSSIPGLIKVLSNEKWSVRRSAVEALGEMGDPVAVSPLSDAYKSEKDWDIRWRIAEALGKIGHPGAIPVLREALSDSDWVVREKAREALVKLESKKP